MLSISVLLADVTASGAPMIYVNDVFCKLTGYERDELLGRPCRMLQGPDTEPEAVRTISAAIRSGSQQVVSLTNYRKDGSRFTNVLTLRPVHDTDGVSA